MQVPAWDILTINTDFEKVFMKTSIVAFRQNQVCIKDNYIKTLIKIGIQIRSSLF